MKASVGTAARSGRSPERGCCAVTAPSAAAQLLEHVAVLVSFHGVCAVCNVEAFVGGKRTDLVEARRPLGSFPTTPQASSGRTLA